MVHLSSVSTDAELEAPITKDLGKLNITEYDDDEEVTNIYGSKFANEGLPSGSMPKGEMPSGTAYRLIKDHLSLDGNPILNLASFVTTYMEPEAEMLMQESLSKNFIDWEEYPQTADIQNRCIDMIARLYNAPTHPGSERALGASTVGSSEAIMLATLALKRRWQNKRKAEGKDYSKPNIIFSSLVQVCWEKAARYFEVEEKLWYCTEDQLLMDPEAAVALVDENTIGICAILGTTYTGGYEDVKGINDLLVKKNLDVPIHVDAASGGFVAPYIVPELEWDFRCEKVVSINVSGHKYGLVYPGVGWVVWRGDEYLPKDLIFTLSYLGSPQTSFTLNFSKGASNVIAQYYQFIRLGFNGYRSIMRNLTRTADYVQENLKALGFLILSEGSGKSLPLVAFRLDPKHNHHFDGTYPVVHIEFALAHQMRERQWIIPAYNLAAHAENVKLLRVVIRSDFTRARSDSLIADIKQAMEALQAMDKDRIESHLKHVKAHTGNTATGPSQNGNAHHKKYNHGKHGKHGKKTHPVC